MIFFKKAFCLLFFYVFCFIQLQVHGLDANSISTRYEKLSENIESIKKNFTTHKDFIIWIGSGLDPNFSLGDLTFEEVNKYESVGLEVVEKMAHDGHLCFQGLLAGYYYNSQKNYKKALYWAQIASEAGDMDGMTILAAAYAKGNGIIEDMSEAMKWYLLAAAMGKDDAKQKLPTLRSLCPEEYLEGEKRAKLWIQSHHQLFFNPD